MGYIFGPVSSSRLGRSLGIDLIPRKVCSFDCVYCECGPTLGRLIDQRHPFVDIRELMRELELYFLEAPLHFDTITITGCGEPTLELHLGRILTELHKRTSIPIAVLTNASLIDREDVQSDLAQADRVLPSLDAVDQELFQKIDRPHPEVSVSKIIDGMTKFRGRFPDVQFWLEVMMVRGFNNSREHLVELKKVVRRINPHRLDVVTVTRPPAYENIEAVSDVELVEIKKFLWGKEENVSHEKLHEVSSFMNEQRILETLYRRPCTFLELLHMCQWNERELREKLDLWIVQGKVKSLCYQGRRFFQDMGKINYGV